MTRFLLASLLVLASASARAETLTWRFDFFNPPHHSYLWGFFGDEFGPFTGEIVSTKIVFQGYSVKGDAQTSDFYFTFDVPVDTDQARIELRGSDMGWTGPGPVSYTTTSEAYNGVIRGGRFGAEINACGPEVEICGGLGNFDGEAYIEFTIEGLRAVPIFTDGFDDQF